MAFSSVIDYCAASAIAIIELQIHGIRAYLPKKLTEVNIDNVETMAHGGHLEERNVPFRDFIVLFPMFRVIAL